MSVFFTAVLQLLAVFHCWHIVKIGQDLAYLLPEISFHVRTCITAMLMVKKTLAGL